MMDYFNLVKEGDQMNLPPGFRFHPTDEELITHYLCNKVFDNRFCAKAIGEVDMNRIEPWELPRLAKMGEKEWYFFCMRDKKYPTGMRTNRATAKGYWKATGKDKDIFRRTLLVGMKKTLVFYKGRAPKGEKTNWVVHEYRLEGKSFQKLPNSATNEWVIIRVFHKNSSGNKVHISELVKINSNTNESLPVSLPPLIDYPMAMCDGKIQKPSISDPSHVPCFSNPVNIQQKNMHSSFLNNPEFNLSSNSSLRRFGYAIPTWQCTFPTNDQAILRGLIQNYGENMKLERDIVTSSQDTGLITGINNEISSTLFGAIDMDGFWNYSNLYDNY